MSHFGVESAFLFLNISCSSTEDYDNSDFTSNVSNSIGGGEPPFIAVGNAGTILKSADGINWIDKSVSEVLDLQNVAFGNNKFVVTGSQIDGINPIFSSSYGEIWNQTSYNFGNTTYKSIFFSGKFIITISNSVYFFYSSSLENWIQTGSGTDQPIACMTKDEDYLYISDNNNSNYATENILSSWSNFSTGLTTVGFTDLTSGNDILVGVKGNRIAYRQMGSWQDPTVPNVDGSLKLVAYGNNVFVAAESASFHTTNNFSDWTKSSVSGSVNQLIYRKGIFVAVGEAGLILTSPDGYNWTSRTSGIVTNLNDVY